LLLSGLWVPALSQMTWTPLSCRNARRRSSRCRRNKAALRPSLGRASVRNTRPVRQWMLQWQIEALWRFQIPEELRQRYGYPALTERAKRKILGLTSARLYGLQAVDPGGYRADTGPSRRTTSRGWGVSRPSAAA
jgi:hypothetical protein